MFVDVILPISLIVLMVVTFGIFLYTQMQTDNEFDELLSAVREELDSPKPFSLAEHYERLMQVSEEIAEEKAKQKYEPTVLWLVLDGMRINEDGTIEWIKKPSRTNRILEEVQKKEKEREPYEQLINEYLGRQANAYVLYADDKPVEAYSTLYAAKRAYDKRLSETMMNCSVEDRLRMQYAQLQASLASQMADIQNQMQSQVLINTMAKRSVDAYGQSFEGEPFYSWAQEL